MNEKESNKLKRRDAIKLMAAAAAAPAVIAKGEDLPAAPQKVRPPSDPNLISPEVPWENLLSEEELKTLSALCDLIIPADSESPSASQLGVPAFINEWVSAPYPTQEADRILIRGGLTWLNAESSKRFGAEFRELSEEQKKSICDEIQWTQSAAPELLPPARFFAKVRDLTATGFYTTPEGWKDIGYIGNQVMLSYDSLPPNVEEKLNEVIKNLKLE